MESFNHWTTMEVLDLGFKETLWLRNRASLRKGQDQKRRRLEGLAVTQARGRQHHVASPEVPEGTPLGTDFGNKVNKICSWTRVQEMSGGRILGDSSGFKLDERNDWSGNAPKERGECLSRVLRVEQEFAGSGAGWGVEGYWLEN